VARPLAAGRDRSRPIYDNRQRSTSESILVADVSEDGAGGKNGCDWGRIFRGTSRNLPARPPVRRSGTLLVQTAGTSM